MGCWSETLILMKYSKNNTSVFFYHNHDSLTDQDMNVKP